MIEVNLFVALWAIRFFFKRARMLFRSQKKRMYTIVVSKAPLRFAVKRVRPRMSPTKMKKNICRIRPAFSARSAYGRITYIEIPKVTQRSPKTM